MKKLILLLIVGFTVSLGYSQTITIRNETSVTIDVGGETVPAADDGCAPTDIEEFGPVTLTTGTQTTFTIPAGRKVRRAGGSDISGSDLGYEIVNCNPMGGSIVSICISGGVYDVVWNSCGYAEIHD